MINRINPNKLSLSKWTAVNPKNKELHFIVTKVLESENGVVSDCQIEALINKNSYQIEWRDLCNSDKWLMGWK